jgi:hypothetical protein
MRLVDEKYLYALSKTSKSKEKCSFIIYMLPNKDEL